MLSDGRSTIGVFGAGYVGLVTAAGFAELGRRVVLCDVDAQKIATLQAGGSVVNASRPVGLRGRAELSSVVDVARSIAKNLDGPTVIVNKSTVPVETGDLVAAIVRESASTGTTPSWSRIRSSCAKAARSPISSTPTGSSSAVTIHMRRRCCASSTLRSMRRS